MNPLGRFVPVAALGSALGLFVACGSEAPGQAPHGERTSGEWAPGVVMVVSLGGDNVEITAADIDRWTETIGRIKPDATLPARRRFSLTNVVLHRSVAQLVDPANRERVRAQAEAAYALAQNGELELEPAVGMYKQLGIEAWGMARDMQPGEWSGVYDTTGAFYFFRLVERPPTDAPWAADTPVRIERAMFPYIDDLDPAGIIDQAIDASKLTVVNPAWEEIVPQHYVYRMQ